MKKIIKYVSAFIIIIILNSCTEDFEKINTDPHGISDKSLEQMFNHIGSNYIPMFQNVFNVTPAWNYQLQQGLMGDVFSGYMTPPTPFASNINNMTYSLVDGWNAFPWIDAYGNIMPQVLKIKNAVNELPGNDGDKFIHLANVIKVMAMHRVSDIYGPLRYTKFENIATTGVYDSQEVAYKAFFNDLGTAIDELEQFEGQTQFIPFDKSNLKGDIGLWRQFANSLRLRLAMRIVKVNPTLAKEQGELSLSSNAGLLLTKNMVINTGFDHPIKTISNSWGDIRMSAEMESILVGYNDQRITKFFQKSEDAALTGDYKGIRMGIAITAKSQYLNHSAIGKVIDEQTLTWITSAEIHFLKAEASLRGWAGSGDAKANYEAGITASFTQHSVENVSNYITDNTSTPANFVDALSPTNNINYGSNVKIAYDITGTLENQLEQIITQKWIAMFPDGQEAWSEFRRTGYPKIFPVVVNNSGGTIDTNTQIRRINFTAGEKDTNGANVTTAVGYLNGADNGGTRLWWDTGASNF